MFFDDLEANVAAAQATGWRAHVIRTTRPHRSGPSSTSRAAWAAP
jgi:FMN phosphatase YigB (HAD superfamily)